MVKSTEDQFARVECVFVIAALDSLINVVRWLARVPEVTS